MLHFITFTVVRKWGGITKYNEYSASIIVLVLFEFVKGTYHMKQKTLFPVGWITYYTVIFSKLKNKLGTDKNSVEVVQLFLKMIVINSYE